jgi:hypothetical protein
MMLEPDTLAAFLSHLQEFQALYETEGVDSLPGPGGDLFCLADLLRLYGMRSYLEPAQAAGIEALYLDLTDSDAARNMGLASPRLVAACTREGLQRLCEIFSYGLWKEGWRDSRQWFHPRPGGPAEAPQRGLSSAGRRG